MNDRAATDGDYATWQLTQQDEDTIYHALRHCLDNDIFTAPEATAADFLLFVMDVSREATQ